MTSDDTAILSTYKQTELGHVPAAWDVKALRDFARIETGSTPPTADPKNYGDEHLFVSPGDMGVAKWITRTEKRLSAKGFAASRRFPQGSVLFVCIGSTIGKCGVASTELTSNQQINAVLPGCDFSSDFLYYALSAATLRVRALAGEQAVPMVNKSGFAETKVALPPVEEQRAIAEALSDTDAVIEGLDCLIAKKRDLKQAAMQQLLTGRTRLPGFEGDWLMQPFGQVLDRLNAKRHQIQVSEYQSTGTYPVVDQGKEPIVGYSDQADKRFRCPKGGVIVFGDHTCIVKFVDFDFLVGADGTQILASQPGQSARFHAYQLQHAGIESTGYNRHFGHLKNRSFVVPPFAEQTAIAGVLSGMDAELKGLELRRQKTLALKQAMMQELLTGRIRLI